MLNGMFICTIGLDGYMTEGKVYEFVEGKFTSDRERQPEIYGSVDNFNARHGVVEIAPYNPTPKDLLTVGRVVELRTGEMGFVLVDKIIIQNGWYVSSDYTEALSSTVHQSYDIIEIFDSPVVNRKSWNFMCKSKEYLNSVWKREEKSSEQREEKSSEQLEKESSEQLEKESSEQLEKESIQIEMEKLAKRLGELEVK